MLSRAGDALAAVVVTALGSVLLALALLAALVARAAGGPAPAPGAADDVSPTA